jgi:tetraacyldisaccharide 4'-kinase
VNALLKPFELLYRGINRVRRALYRRGVLKSKRLPVPVISIGNRSVGGSGKTPAVIAVARALADRGLRVAVLTRGYGRSGTEQGPVTSLDAAVFGDEPALIKSKLKNIDVIVGSNRHENATRLKADVFVLDDGFQHLQLHRDCDVVIEAPARFFREGPSALRDADVVIPRTLRVVNGDAIRGRRVFAFSGLADNEQFFGTVRAQGADVIGTRGFPDHHRYTAADLAAIREAARGALLVTTEKDAVKIGAADDMIPLVVELEIADEALAAILQHITLQ